jgi:hypothetical protein
MLDYLGIPVVTCEGLPKGTLVLTNASREMIRKYLQNLIDHGVLTSPVPEVKVRVDENDPTLLHFSFPQWIEEEEIEMVLVREIKDDER